MKKCPFCGKQPKENKEEGIWREHHSVFCETQNCIGAPFKPRTYPTNILATKAWNTRASGARALEAKKRAAETMYEALKLAEHKIDQHLQGQYTNGLALGIALTTCRKALVLADAATKPEGRG